MKFYPIGCRDYFKCSHVQNGGFGREERRHLLLTRLFGSFGYGPKKNPSICPFPETRTGSVQKVCGGVWQGFDHLTKLESSKVEVVLQ